MRHALLEVFSKSTTTALSPLVLLPVTGRGSMLARSWLSLHCATVLAEPPPEPCEPAGPLESVELAGVDVAVLVTVAVLDDAGGVDGGLVTAVSDADDAAGPPDEAVHEARAAAPAITAAASGSEARSRGRTGP